MFLAFLERSRNLPAIRHDPVFLVFAQLFSLRLLRAAWARRSIPIRCAPFQLARGRTRVLYLVAWW
jgi:hypothetical protein